MFTRTLGAIPAPWHRPSLCFNVPVDDAGGGGGDSANEDLGFPKDTPVADMTPEQKAAYWHNQTKVQQKAREDAEKVANTYKTFGTVEDLQSAADAAEQARLDALGDNEKAIEAARAAGKAEGAQEATRDSGKLLGAAITGMLIAHTKGAQESFEDASARVAGAIEFADLTKFVGEDGTLDAAKVQTFAQSIGSTGGDNGSQSSAGWGAQFQQDHAHRLPPVPGATGSLASMEQAAYDAMKPKTAQ